MDKKLNGFGVPPLHTNFLAKKLFEGERTVRDVAIAKLDICGGGPTELHTHQHDHLFVVVKGEAKIILGEETAIVRENESFLVKGMIPHSVWNNVDYETTMIGITLE